MISRRGILALGPAAAAMIGGAARATAQESGAPASLGGEKIARVEAILAAEISRRQIPGLTIAVANRERVLWEKAYGFADLENNSPVKEGSRFRTASLAKPMTAVAVLQLVERGKMKLDAEIREYVPGFTPKQWPVTVRQLLGHLGGVRHYDNSRGEMQMTRHYNDVVAAIEIFAKDPLVHQPGTKYLYTTYGYNLLGAAVQEVADVPYVDYVRTNILGPARMANTVPDDHFAIIPNRVRGYMRTSDNRIVNAALADTSNKIPGGGYVTTAADMARFALAFRQTKLVKRETVELMLRQMRLADGTGTGYGMGWQIWGQGQTRIIGHTGSQPGTNTFLGMTVSADWITCILTNLEGGAPKTIADLVFDALRAAS